MRILLERCIRLSFCGVLSVAFASESQAQSVPDTALLAEIEAIRAVDAHAHPMPALGSGKAEEFDPPDSVPPLGPPALLRLGNPQWRQAWRALYGYPAESDSLDLRRLASLKATARFQQGSRYPGWVLDKLNIETMLANRHAGAQGIDPPRFRLVWYVDPLVFPLDNESAKSANPQRRADYASEEVWLKRYMSDEKLERLPPTLDEYISLLVVPALERRKREGAVAVKFAMAYLRDLRVGDPSRDEAASVYSSYVGGRSPTAAEYRKLQDYLVRRIAREAGRLGLVVQIHVGAGAGPFFDNVGADPFLLMPVLLDPTMRGTNFVLVHGGFPSAAATRVLFAKPNVYVDFSSQAFLSSTRELSQVIRSWIEFRPEKVMFGTDAYSLSRAIGWEEVGWLASTSSRRALALALTGMIQDREITRERASAIAKMVMRENAISVYRLKREPSVDAWARPRSANKRP